MKITEDKGRFTVTLSRKDTAEIKSISRGSGRLPVHYLAFILSQLIREKRDYFDSCDWIKNEN